MHLCLLALVLTTHAFGRTAQRRVQIFDEVDSGVTQGDNSVMDDNEPRETEHKPLKIVETEHEKLVTIIKKVSTKKRSHFVYLLCSMLLFQCVKYAIITFFKALNSYETLSVSFVSIKKGARSNSHHQTQ